MLNKSKDRPKPRPTSMSEEQMGQQSPMSSPTYHLQYSPPRPSKLRQCMTVEDTSSQTAKTAQYLSKLRNAQPTRPSGARPPPSSKFGSLRRTETQPVEPKPTNDDRPTMPTSNSMPIMPVQQRDAVSLPHSSVSMANLRSAASPFAGRPLARPPASPLPPTPETEDTPIPRLIPSVPYLESGSRWMEKQEAKSLRKALEDMDLEEERKLYASAQDEAAELVYKHQNPGTANGPKVFANPDLSKDYRSHLRRGSYQRRHSMEISFSSEGHRSASEGSQTSNSDKSIASSSNKRANVERSRKSSPPSDSGAVSVHKRRESAKNYDQLAQAVANDIAVAHRRSSSGSRRVLSGEKKMFMHPNDKIWEDPQEERSSLEKSRQTVEVNTEPVPAAKPLPSHVRKNPFARVRAERPERSNSAPTLQTLPPAPDLRHERVEIQRNPPSQSRNPWYMSNESLPPTPPSAQEHSPDEVAPKMTPTKDGKEVRGDDIRAATSKTRKDYSPNLPRPTMVSDKPGRPIVSFQQDWRPKEVVMEEQRHFQPEPPKMAKPSSFPREPQMSPSRPSIPHIAFDHVPEAKPPIPQINLPDEPSVPSIVLPEDASSANNVPTINVEVPSITIDNGGALDDSPRNQAGRRPLPATRPLPRHAATTPVAATRSMPHYTPTARQSGVLCAHCALPIAGRILSAAGERFHPGCFVCHECDTNLELVAFYPEPEKQRDERLQVEGDDSLRFYCHLDFHELFSPRCKSCKTPIEGEVIVACGAEWHAGHFFCAQCGDPFDSTMPFVEKDGYAWCVGCHTNRYSSKCRKCKKPVTDLVVKALGSDWHSDCFVCTECNGEFSDGRYFLRGESQDPVCVKCEEKRLKA